MPGPEDFNPLPQDIAHERSVEDLPHMKARVVEALAAVGEDDVESMKLLEEYTSACQAEYLRQGREDAHLEALREKAHALRQADRFAQAIEVMNDVAIATMDADPESHEEAMWVIGKLQARLAIQSSGSTYKYVQEKPMTLDESGEPVAREEVVIALRKVHQSGVTDPVDTQTGDSKFAEVAEMVKRWEVQRGHEVKGDKDAEARFNFERTTIYFDAGFNDQIYLQDLLGWLYQDAENVAKDPSNQSSVELRKDIANAIRKIRAQLLMK